MKSVLIFVIAAFFAYPAVAQQGNAAPLEVSSAADVNLDDLVWVKRPLVVFADSPNDPAFIRQMDNLRANPKALADRDVTVIVDTDPKARSALRTRLRPRGFSLVLLDKKGVVVLRKPLPWKVRELAAAIDKLPIRIDEMKQLLPAGR